MPVRQLKKLVPILAKRLRHFSNIKNQMSALLESLGSATSGVQTLSGAFKALLANPVSAVILLIVGHYRCYIRLSPIHSRAGKRWSKSSLASVPRDKH